MRDAGLSNLYGPGQTCHSKDGGSCIFHWRGRAWLTIWDRVKIPRYSHKPMHRKRVTCELHDSYFNSMTIKHAIPKTVEVAYSIGVGELGWQYGTGLKSHGTVTNRCTGREWPVNCMTVISTRWRSNMPFQRRRKCIFRWPVMGRDWVDIEQLYNSVLRKFNEFGEQKSWRNDAVEKTALRRELGPRASGWATLENEKDTRLCPEELGTSICYSSVWSPSLSHTQPFQIKWEVYFSKRTVLFVFIIASLCSAYICKCACIWLYNNL